jgi:two-component system KDP operon response regulator KdpE
VLEAAGRDKAGEAAVFRSRDRRSRLAGCRGAEFVERSRASSQVPIIVLSVQSKEAEKVRLLELGTDDYLVKPFGMAELLTRSHAAPRAAAGVACG